MRVTVMSVVRVVRGMVVRGVSSEGDGGEGCK